MRELAAMAVAACAAALGESATYSPVVGAPKVVNVFRRSAEQIIDGLNATMHRHDGALFEVAAAALAEAPKAGDSVVCSDGTWRVRSVARKDPLALVWTLDCVPVA